jgi:hypothetical protein
MFAKASKDAAMSWQYNPAVANGKPQGGYVLMPIDCSSIREWMGEGSWRRGLPLSRIAHRLRWPASISA